MHGACMVIERLVYGEKIKQLSDKFSIANLLRLMLTFTIVNFAWIFFRVNSVSDVALILEKIISDPGRLFIDLDTMFYAFLFMIIMFVVDYMDEYYPRRFSLINSRSAIVRWSAYISLAAMILLFGVLDGGSFIYFQF